MGGKINVSKEKTTFNRNDNQYNRKNTSMIVSVSEKRAEIEQNLTLENSWEWWESCREGEYGHFEPKKAGSTWSRENWEDWRQRERKRATEKERERGKRERVRVNKRDKYILW